MSDVLQQLAARLPLEQRDWQLGVTAGSYPQAAVLVMLTDEVEPTVLLGRRALHLRNHPGEVAFPGGKREAEDASPWVTAKREAMEEVGLAYSDVHPLGELSPLITRTGFEVSPCVAKVPRGLQYVMEPEEFDSIFTQPLQRFAQRQYFSLQTAELNGQVRTVPHYHIDDDHIWGVTAAVLAMLANLAYDAGLDLQHNWNQKT